MAVCVVDAGGEAESCDGIDNDCDGLTDDGAIEPPAGITCPLVGVCATYAGYPVACQAAEWTCAHLSDPDYEAKESTCDGLDNDCDGLADGGLVKGMSGEVVDRQDFQPTGRIRLEMAGPPGDGPILFGGVGDAARGGGRAGDDARRHLAVRRGPRGWSRLAVGAARPARTCGPRDGLGAEDGPGVDARRVPRSPPAARRSADLGSVEEHRGAERPLGLRPPAPGCGPRRCRTRRPSRVSVRRGASTASPRSASGRLVLHGGLGSDGLAETLVGTASLTGGLVRVVWDVAAAQAAERVGHAAVALPAAASRSPAVRATGRSRCGGRASRASRGPRLAPPATRSRRGSAPRWRSTTAGSCSSVAPTRRAEGPAHQPGAGRRVAAAAGWSAGWEAAPAPAGRRGGRSGGALLVDADDVLHLVGGAGEAGLTRGAVELAAGRAAASWSTAQRWRGPEPRVGAALAVRRDTGHDLAHRGHRRAGASPLQDAWRLASMPEPPRRSSRRCRLPAADFDKTRPAVAYGQATWDPVGQRVLLYGGELPALGGASAVLWALDPVAGTFSKPDAQGEKPPAIARPVFSLAPGGTRGLAGVASATPTRRCSTGSRCPR